jgi:7-cyano-7-deazaguanine synthase
MNATTPEKAVILTSGGLDSTTVLALAKEQGYGIYCLSFDYGQRHRFEIDAARNVARFFDVQQHLIIPIDLTTIGGSALTADIAVPKNRDGDQMATSIPVTYVPARNTIFLSFALAWAETLSAGNIFIGVNALDYSGYPDCRPEYIDAFQKMANLATKAAVEDKCGIRIHAPLIHMTKAQIIQTGDGLGVDYSLTHSCYDPSPAGAACGHCDSCVLRRNGFRAAGVADPTRYDSGSKPV